MAKLDHLAVIMHVVQLQRLMNVAYVVVMVLPMVLVTVMVMLMLVVDAAKLVLLAVMRLVALN